MLRVISANLNGIRSAVSKGFLEWLAVQDADFICLQELKAQADNMTADMLNPPGYYGYFHYAEKKGYSGVGVYARRQPLQIIEGLGVPEIDAEGRYLELVYDTLSIISVYLPSGSSGDHRQAAKFVFMEHFFAHLANLVKCGRQVILCGDWNIAHKEIDLKNWKGNLKNSGFLPEERAWLTRVFDEIGWVDVYRRLHPEATGDAYTWWSNRGQAWAKNVGWRIDYQIASPEIAATATTASIYKEQRFSDHAPLTIDYETAL
ncbi:exodeoxyribonuclease III [Pollutimonas sp. M17]|uniref:exodeoxyribonuclease III n=1 Tax=Pollutimonas sp. M17 TaxID=2962065 RepID=UPI0021F3CF58|nr:exodeoxyribonuclease III [Pollutimonas sp. M17]UYO94223.1 exodeoxyribonuclease III [Pollutimonas sp. M17]HWK71250.1 exodeoxyribonuclease III [Burkholderiaceae bacterium]